MQEVIVRLKPNHVTSALPNGQLCILTTEAGEPVEHMQEVKDFRGDIAYVCGGKSPRHAGSTGRVYVRRSMVDSPSSERDYFPSVFGLKWMILQRLF